MEKTGVMIEVKDVRKSLKGQQVLRGVNLNVYKGELLAVIGVSGGGKSVLLKHIIRLMKPDHGTITIDGKDITVLDDRRLNPIREKFGMLFQSGALFDSINVYDNVAFPLRERTKLTEEQVRLKVLSTLKDVGLSRMERKFPAEMSGGMKKRVALARAIVTDPEIVFFDEPTTGLDPVRKNAIHALIKENHYKYGYTGLIISHEIPDIFDVADRVAMLHEGRIVFEGAPDEIMNSDIPEVRAFIHCCPTAGGK
jgi:phospholipid/cholesterol/gamma-HCH transport system ATP-binding protein